jgi:carbamate kinase
VIDKDFCSAGVGEELRVETEGLAEVIVIDFDVSGVGEELGVDMQRPLQTMTGVQNEELGQSFAPMMQEITGGYVGIAIH